MQISNLLREKGHYVATIAGDQSVAEALSELSRNGVGALVVSRDGCRADGIISERDIVRHLDRRGPEILDMDVARLMTSSVFMCAPDDDVNVVMREMTQRRIRHVPVVAGGILVGIVSIGDVVKSRITELETDRDSLLDYIGAR